MKPTSIKQLLCILLLLISGIANAQKKPVEVREVNVSEFPKITAKVWVRDPNGRDSALPLNFYEDNTNVAIKPKLVKFKRIKDSLPKNKCVVFLVLNPNDNAELNWYKNVLTSSLSANTIKKGDKIGVLNFNYQTNGKLLDPMSLDFSDDINTLTNKTNSIALRPGGLSMCADKNFPNKTPVLDAINEAIDRINKKNPGLPTSIIVLANDQFCSSSSIPVIDNALNNNISIYCINYEKPKVNSLENECQKTFGLYYSNGAHDIAASASVLQGWLTDFIQYQAGWYYEYTYQSVMEKDGKSHALKVVLNNVEAYGTVSVPGKNLWEWIVANPILSSALGLMFILLIIMLIVLLKNRKKKKLLMEQLRQQQMSDMDKKHRMEQDALSSKLSSQQQEMEAIKRKAQQEKDAEMRRKAEEENKKRLEALTAQMKRKGNFPWFDYSTGGANKQRYEIRKAEIIVGRTEGCDLRIDLPTVSKKHFSLSYNSYGVYIVKDLGSSNGLYVNGQ
jgi:hypothetical protein